MLALRCAAQSGATMVRPPLTQVTVYLNGTALEHEARVTLAAGLNQLTLGGLSPLMDAETLEIGLGEGAELVGVSQEEQAGPVVLNKSAVDSLARNGEEQGRLDAELKGLEQERLFLLANQTLPAGTQASWSAELQKGAALMRTRLPAIQREASRLRAALEGLQRQAAQLGPRAAVTGAATRASLQVQAARAQTVLLTVRYYVPGEQPWAPGLAIRANATGQQLQFVNHGEVHNQSGLPWERVKLALVRYEQGTDVSRPILTPWMLDFNNTQNAGEGRVDQFVVKGTAKGRPVDVKQSTRYEAPDVVTLAAGGRRELTLSSVRLAARPEYLAVPRLSEHVFLQAKVTGWEALQLPNEAKVYHQGAYVGTTELDPRAYNDSLEVALGHDPLLVVGRAKLEDFSENVALSDKRRVRLKYELNVRNNHPETVRLRLLDEVPVSAEKEIDVKVLDISGAQLDERTGKLTWILTLAPGASERRSFSFQVDYPKNQEVKILKHKSRISAPRTR